MAASTASLLIARHAAAGCRNASSLSGRLRQPAAAPILSTHSLSSPLSVASISTTFTTTLRSSVVSLPRRYGHTVRIILTNDLPDGRGYNGDVMTVKAGYARNYLVPQKLALYATPETFERLGMADPDAETMEEKRARMAAEAAAEEDEEAAADLRAADLLKHYLRNKVLKIWRNVNSSTGAVHPGLVNAQDVREKLSRQLKIDLEDHETVQLRAKPVELGHAELEEEDVDRIMEEIGSSGDEESAGEGKGAECKVEIRQLGEFMAKISLRGSHVVPLKFAVLKR